MALADPEVELPAQPALVAGVRWCTWVSPSGDVENIDSQTAQGRITSQVIPIVCHARNTAQRLRIQPFPSLDVLELFAFVNPTQFAVPTPLGIAQALGLALPNSQERAAETLFEASNVQTTRCCAFHWLAEHDALQEERRGRVLALRAFQSIHHCAINLIARFAWNVPEPHELFGRLHL